MSQNQHRKNQRVNKIKIDSSIIEQIESFVYFWGIKKYPKRIFTENDIFSIGKVRKTQKPFLLSANH